MFKALVRDKTPDFARGMRDVRADLLPDGDVTTDIVYSMIDYKDALVFTSR